MALYRQFNPNIDKKCEELIFDDIVYDEDISLKEVANIEKEFKENGYVKEENINTLLNYVSAYSRLSVCGIGTIYATSMTGYCFNSALINYELLTKMGFNAKAFNISDVINQENTIHELCIVNIPTLINNEIVNKEIILDPTFKQFCIKEGCSKERYNGEKRYSIRKATPMPGYFLSLTEEGTQFAKDINYYGYFEKTDTNFKMYCDSFKLFTMGKEDYEDPSLVGNISKLDIDLNFYNNNLQNSKNDGLKMTNNIVKIKTPLEAYNEYEAKSRSKLKFLKAKREKILKEKTETMLEPEFNIRIK